MHSLSCLEPFQQLAVITTPTRLARMLIYDEAIFCVYVKWLCGRSCIRFKIYFKGCYNQISKAVITVLRIPLRCAAFPKNNERMRNDGDSDFLLI